MKNRSRQHRRPSEGIDRRRRGLVTAFHLTCLLLLPLTAEVVASADETVLTGEDIPRQLPISSHFIFDKSDSVYLNGRLLQRGIDYSFNSRRGAFDFSSLQVTSSDTLIVRYHKLPSWLQASYGRDLPEIAPNGSRPDPPVLRPTTGSPRPSATDLTLSGAKSFRFSARTAGASEFSQSLDLTVSGELTPGVTLKGAVSDRGYDPSYGTANSRLSELDRINLTLTSKSFRAQVGDIESTDRMSSTPVRPRSVSGAMFELRRPHWHIDGLAARPKGRYAGVQFMGSDGLQGPYMISESGRSQPVVPGSETVWLDGEQLERGSGKDYIIEYPTGRVTFNVNHPIDSRRRIEIDYQPLAAAYKGELLAAGGGYRFADSLLTVEVRMARDGDDKDQPLWGEPTAEDRRLLAAVGDSVDAAVRSGVRVDSTGSYVLVSESLPDSVFRYVGADSGDYAVTFSYVGAGAGSYRYIGADRYEYVGAAGGDYLPLLTPEAAERFDHLQLRTQLRTHSLGVITADVRQSRYDRNLFSELDDSDNDGLYYRLQLDKDLGGGGAGNEFAFDLRHRQHEYRALERLNPPEFRREFFLPTAFAPATDETLLRGHASTTPMSWLALHGGLARLEYERDFRSNRGFVQIEMQAHKRFEIDGRFDGIRAKLTADDSISRGNGEHVVGNARVTLLNGLALTSGYEQDNRKHEYNGVAQGTRYRQYTVGLQDRSEGLRYQDYREDSLSGQWNDSFRRRRASITSNRRWGNLCYRLSLSHQWLDRVLLSEKSFLGRLGYGYHDSRRNFALEGAYVVSTETRHARGITYLEVEPGRGDFVLEDGSYLPDPDGNFIQVEEILSDRSRVRRGERSFHFRREFSQVYMRFESRIEEELLDDGERKWHWVIPFISDRSQPYLFYDRRYDADLRLAKGHGFHFVNLAYSEDRQQRMVAGQVRLRYRRSESLSLKQTAREFYFEQKLELFQVERDQSYGAAGEVDGFRITLSARRQFEPIELTFGAGFRQAESAEKERSRLYTTSLGARRRLLRRGELRSMLELYTQQLTNVTAAPSYLLSDNRPGKRGAIWSVSVNYGLKGELRLNFSLTGRHADNRTARITGRGELIAGF